MEPHSSSSKPLFEIHDPSISVEELMKEIESRIKLRNLDREELDRIIRMRFSPDSPAGYREFDPSHTANLFEKGISTPKFTNPRLWWVKGPLKSGIRVLAEFFAILDKKLSHNRIMAFYQVLHELISLRKRIRELESALEIQGKERQILEESLAKGKDWKTLSDFFEQRLYPAENILILHPRNCEIPRLFQLAGKNILVLTFLWKEREILKSHRIPFVNTSSFEVSSMDIYGYPFLLIGSPLQRLSESELYLLFSNLAQEMEPSVTGFCFFSQSREDRTRPFQGKEETDIVLEYFVSYLQEIGFANVKAVAIPNSPWIAVGFSKASVVTL